MAEVNDIAFRTLCKRAGAGLTYTGMINPLTKEKLLLDDRPAMQLFCVSAGGVAEFVGNHEKQTPLFDFNLGCPSGVAERCGFGAFMHNKLETIEEILKTMKDSTDRPITVKLRKSGNVAHILKLAEKYCDAVGIHPRTEKQGYSGKPDISFALELKRKTRLPVIYSGNVDAVNAKSLLKKFDFLMIGRAAMRNPNVFAEWQGKKSEITFADYLELAERYGIRFRQIKLQAIHFASGREGSKSVRVRLMAAKNLDDIRKIASQASFS
jgi:tRNA-dihydrouridine synthase B